MAEFTIDELRQKTDPEVLEKLHPRQKMALMDEILGSSRQSAGRPITQERLDRDRAHFVALDAVESSILRDPR